MNLVGFVDEAAMDPPRGSREFAEQYGYGLAALPPGVRSPDVGGEGLDAGAPEPGEDWKPEGCDVWARGQMAAVAADQDATYRALKTEVDRIDAEVVPAHPDVIAADAAWSACMADAGYPGYARQPEAEERERARFDAPDVANGAVGPDGMTDGQRSELPHERALATADWTCAHETGYQGVVGRVRAAAQQDTAAHRDAPRRRPRLATLPA